jgi:hypothetical protein
MLELHIHTDMHVKFHMNVYTHSEMKHAFEWISR